MLSYVQQERIGIVSNLRFISMKKIHAQLSWAWKKGL